MARVGETERLVDSLVNRGLVAPKFVGRQVGQATIEELKNLGTSLATSQATRRNEDINRAFDFSKQASQTPLPYINRQVKPETSLRKIVGGLDFSKQQILGRNPAGVGGFGKNNYTVLTPFGKGQFQLRTETGDSDIIRNLASTLPAGSDISALPELNTFFAQKQGKANIGSIEELQARLASIIKDPAAYQKLIGA